MDFTSDFVLLKPPLKKGTVVLWLGPFAMCALALFVGAIFFRRQRKALKNSRASLALTDEERERLKNLLKD